MAELKTKPTQRSVARFLRSIRDERVREDCLTLSKIMRQATRARPTLWGTSIVGFGSYHFQYASGREGDWFTVGFSPRKGNLTLYVMGSFRAFPPLLKKLGKHKMGVGCLYIRSLDDVDLPTLKELIRESVKAARAAAKRAS